MTIKLDGRRKVGKGGYGEIMYPDMWTEIVLCVVLDWTRDAPRHGIQGAAAYHKAASPASNRHSRFGDGEKKVISKVQTN